MISNSTRILLVFTLCLLALATHLPGVPEPLRVLGWLVFLTFAPGVAVVPMASLRSQVDAWLLVVIVSLCVDGVIALILLYSSQFAFPASVLALGALVAFALWLVWSYTRAGQTKGAP